ncbi:hypothetical protein JCM3765_005177 [Sporobolomyces pararoseus]
MCGIVFSIRTLKSPQRDSSSQDTTSSTPSDQSTSSPQEPEWLALTSAVADRGPDYSNTLTLETLGSSLELKFHTTVLHLRGEKVTPQPFREEKSGDILCWNGEIFDSPLLPVEMTENDGDKLFSLIQKIGFLKAMKRLDGPHSLVYYEKLTEKVWFTRDCLGRRSLLTRKENRKGEFVLTSTGTPDIKWEEISCQEIWELDLKAFERGEEYLKMHQRYYESEAPSEDSLVYPFNRLNNSLPSPGSLLPMTRSFPPLPVLTPAYLSLISTFKSLLLDSIRQRVLTIPFDDNSQNQGEGKGRGKPRIGILFSGGLDCTSLALLTDEVLPSGEGIDLINVSFENPRKLELANGGGKSKLGGKKKKETKKERQDRIKREENGEPEPEPEPTQIEPEPVEVPPLGGGESIYDVPDRLTGLSTWRELCQLRPNRTWNFVKVDVPYQEMLSHRQKVIDLMKPQDTVMDLSIAIAFYFASRGKGTLANDSLPTSEEPYTSTSRVLLSGLGADELLGGYSRHRKAYNQYLPPNSDSPPPLPDSVEGHSRWISLIEELSMDLARISTRNLGRDDRIISSNSKEVRYPFLSTKVVSFLSDLPVWEKCDMRFEEGLGEKLLLRMLVRDLMSLKNEFGGVSSRGEAWRLKKRAIHFGARTAKMELETGKAKGTDRL